MYADRINDNEERISQSSRNSDTGPPPSYQSHHYTPPANQGRREHIWIDIEKGRESNTHTHSAFSLQSNRYLPEPSSREYPTSITELSRLGHTDQSYSHRTLSTQLPLSQSHFTYIQATSTPSSLASITSFATLAEAKRSLTIHLYKSIPIRLLAYVILLFNALLVIKVMAEPMSSLAMNGGNMYEETGQIRLGGSALEQRIPCVAATSHNDEMQAAPFVSLSL